ncbi:hypothetical protein ACA758_05095 [Mycoplasmopsis agassizii]|uniref:hypothetical protein n=1 Tax=Mycoplasmopsis agassizii TaxID=33922 RepID=UPI0035273BD0
MSSHRKKLFLTISVISFLTFVSLSISCSSHTKTVKVKNHGILLNTEMDKQNLVNNKKLSLITFNSEIVSKIYGEKFKTVEPILITTKSELEKFLNHWKTLLLEYYDKDKDFSESLSKSKDELESYLLSNSEKIREIYGDDYFQNNLMVVDLGGEIQPVGKTSEFFYNINSVINNLSKVSVKENEITFTYTDPKLYPDEENFAQAYSVIYSLNRKEFGLSSNNYKIKKQFVQSTPISSRLLNHYSFINQDLSKYEIEKNSNWSEKFLNDETKFATIVIKSKTKLDALLEKYGQSFKKKFEIEFPKEVKSKIIQDFNENYFEENVLVLLSAYSWPGYNSLFSKTIENSYDVKIDENNLKFIIFTSNSNIPLQTVEVDEKAVDYRVSNDKNSSGLGTRSNESHTLFLKMSKKLVKNLNELKSSVEFSDD